VLKTDAVALRAKRHEMGRSEHAMSVVPTPCSSPSWNPPIAFTIDPPPAAASGRGLCASRAPASHTATTPALPPAGGYRSQMAQRNVMRAARRIAFSSTVPAWCSQPAASLLSFWRDRIKMRSGRPVLRIS
jgi:hypothetical protein